MVTFALADVPSTGFVNVTDIGVVPLLQKFFRKQRQEVAVADEKLGDVPLNLQVQAPGTVRELLGGKQQKLVTAARGEKIGHLIEVMKQHGISQMPVLAADGSAGGLVHE